MTKVIFRNQIDSGATRSQLNSRARANGIGGCGICGDTWDWKQSHSIKYSESRGAFPICEECWQTESDAEIILATRKLAALWNAQAPKGYEAQIKADGEAIVNAVREALKERKRQ